MIFVICWCIFQGTFFFFFFRILNRILKGRGWNVYSRWKGSAVSWPVHPTLVGCTQSPLVWFTNSNEWFCHWQKGLPVPCFYRHRSYPWHVPDMFPSRFRLPEVQRTGCPNATLMSSVRQIWLKEELSHVDSSQLKQVYAYWSHTKGSHATLWQYTALQTVGHLWQLGT